MCPFLRYGCRPERWDHRLPPWRFQSTGHRVSIAVFADYSLFFKWVLGTVCNYWRAYLRRARERSTWITARADDPGLCRFTLIADGLDDTPRCKGIWLWGWSCWSANERFLYEQVAHGVAATGSAVNGTKIRHI